MVGITKTFPVHIKGKNIPSKLFFAPINTGFTIKDHTFARLYKFYEERSGRGIGVTYVGNVAISQSFAARNNELCFNDNASRWKKLVKKIKSNGSIPAVQLACFCSKIKPSRIWINSEPKGYVDTARRELKEIPTDFIKKIIAQYVNNARKAFDLGFEIIQIHAAHGYLLSQFLSPIFNLRNDVYGQRKSLIIKEIVEGIRHYLPKSILDLRFSLKEGVNDTKLSCHQKAETIKEIVKLDLDVLSISNGIYNINKNFIYPPTSWGHGVFIPEAIALASKYLDKIWNVAGNIMGCGKGSSNKVFESNIFHREIAGSRPRIDYQVADGG